LDVIYGVHLCTQHFKWGQISAMVPYRLKTSAIKVTLTFISSLQFWNSLILTHCGRVTQICVFNTVKLGTSQVLLSATLQGGMFPEVSHPQALLGYLKSIF